MKVFGNAKDQCLALLNALDLVSPLAGNLDGRLGSLSAGVHGQHHVVAEDVADLLGPLGEHIVVEGSRAQRQTGGLVDESLDKLGVAVALVDGAVGGQEVEVLLALGIPDVDALGLGEDYGQRVVVVGSELVLGGDGSIGGCGVEARSGSHGE